MDIQTSIGLDSYYCRFIEGFSRIDYLIISLQKKGRIFKRKVDSQHSFKQLKHLLISTLLLKVVDLENEFIVSIDACQGGVGGVLMHDGKLIAYESQKL